MEDAGLGSSRPTESSLFSALSSGTCPELWALPGWSGRIPGRKEAGPSLNAGSLN